MSNVFTTLKVIENIPATLKISTEFPTLNSAIEDALEYALSADDDAAVNVFYDDIHAVTIEKFTDDYIRCYYNSNESEKFKIYNELSFRRAAFFIARATIADDLIASHLDNVEAFTVTIAK